MGNTSSADQLLFVSRRGDSRSGGEVGHRASRFVHKSLHIPLRYQEWTVDLPTGFKWTRKLHTYRQLRKGFIAGVDERVKEAFVKELHRVDPKRVVLDNSLYGPLAIHAARRGVQVVTQLHNCEYDYFAGEVALRGGLTADFLKAAYLSERQAVWESDLLFVLSAHDAERVQHLYETPAPIVVLNPMLHASLETLAESRESGASSYVGRRGKDRKFIFLGSAWFQNRRACSDLVARWKSAWGELRLIGTIGEWALREYGAQALHRIGVSSVGFVDDLRAELKTADAVLCPMQLGSGIKVKVLDALAQGCRVLVSKEARIGFEFAEASGHLLALDWRQIAEPDGLACLPPPNDGLLRHQWRGVCLQQRQEATAALSRLDSAA